MGPINNIPTLLQIIARHRPGDKPLSEPMMASLLTHVCSSRPQWVFNSGRDTVSPKILKTKIKNVFFSEFNTSLIGAVGFTLEAFQNISKTLLYMVEMTTLVLKWQLYRWLRARKTLTKWSYVFLAVTHRCIHISLRITLVGSMVHCRHSHSLPIYNAFCLMLWCGKRTTVATSNKKLLYIGDEGL